MPIGAQSLRISRVLKSYGSAAALARRLGVHPSTVRRWAKYGAPRERKAELRRAWETRPKLPRPSTLLRLSASTLAERLGVTERTAQKYKREGSIPGTTLSRLFRPQLRPPHLRAIPKTRPKKFRSQRAEGTIETLTFPSGTTLNTETYRQLRQWFETRKTPLIRGPSVRHYAFVRGEVDLFLVGAELIGYPGRAKQTDYDEATVEVDIPSGAFRTKRAMLHSTHSSRLGSGSFLQNLKRNATAQAIGLIDAVYRVSRDVE